MGFDPCRVSVVLDRGFGDRLAPLAQTGPVWIIDSPENQAAAQVCWSKNPIASHLVGVTVFKSFDLTSPQDALVANLDTIELHHGEYSAPIRYNILEVIGTPRTSTIDVALTEYGFDQFEDNPDGFRATRS